jgi:uncharacterized protein (DUF1330 family)
MTAGPKELNEAFLRSLPDEGPVVMLNLVRFRPRSLDGQGTGWDAYVRYSQGFMPLLKACGGAIVWAGEAEGLAYGDLGDRRWDYVVLVRYPSRAAFLETVTSEAYAAANAHREAGVENHVIIASRQTYPKG